MILWKKNKTDDCASGDGGREERRKTQGGTEGRRRGDWEWFKRGTSQGDMYNKKTLFINACNKL